MSTPRIRPVDTLDLLRRYESPNVTYLDPDGTWPMVWDRARGTHVWDVEGRRYLDLTAAFGVASAGHANPRVVRAGQGQMARLLHAMGDVHPHALKARLARELSRLTFERWTTPNPLVPEKHSASGRTLFCNAGFEAVEAALKTALLATNKPGVIAFEGAYHGLGYGALTTTHREHFRSPFRRQLFEFASFAPFPRTDTDLGPLETELRRRLRQGEIGAFLVEPMQARGGIRIPPVGFLPLLRRLGDEHGALLIVDEIYTGFGRTGRWFACEHSGVVPDLICLGKALTGGFPLSACVGRSELMMAAWPKSTGEAIHTSTFLGHPVGCAMALAQIRELERRELTERSARLGLFLLSDLAALHSPRLTFQARGRGLMAGLEIRHLDGRPATEVVLALVKRMLARGFILLPEGEHAEVLGFTPPLTIAERDLQRVVRVLAQVLGETVSL
ncbi:MAG: aspartate aminotransferase family protein [Limisphaerales bacterium]